jgi:hypothetical protein
MSFPVLSTLWLKYLMILIRDAEASMYMHPDYQARPCPKFSKKYDYYSLGIVFVEIARWRPITHILERRVQITNKTTITQTQEIQSILLDEDADENYAADIEFRMGSVYKKVAYRCLAGDFGDEIKDGQNLQGDFLQQIIQPLDSCII